LYPPADAAFETEYAGVYAHDRKLSRTRRDIDDTAVAGARHRPDARQTLAAADSFAAVVVVAGRVMI